MNLKKLERYLRVNLLGPGPRLMNKRIYRAAVSQSLSNTALYLTILYEYVLVIGCYEFVHFYTDCTR
jgi:hypothetical protein